MHEEKAADSMRVRRKLNKVRSRRHLNKHCAQGCVGQTSRSKTANRDTKEIVWGLLLGNGLEPMQDAFRLFPLKMKSSGELTPQRFSSLRRGESNSFSSFVIITSVKII